MLASNSHRSLSTSYPEPRPPKRTIRVSSIDVSVWPERGGGIGQGFSSWCQFPDVNPSDKSRSHVSLSRRPSNAIPPWIAMVRSPMLHAAWAPRGGGRTESTSSSRHDILISRGRLRSISPIHVSFSLNPLSLMPPKRTRQFPTRAQVCPKRPVGMPELSFCQLSTRSNPLPMYATHVSSRCRPKEEHRWYITRGRVNERYASKIGEFPPRMKKKAKLFHKR